jgi:hypothetical protein
LYRDRIAEEHFVALARQAVLMRDFTRKLQAQVDVSEEAAAVADAWQSFISAGKEALRDARKVGAIPCFIDQTIRLAATVIKSGNHLLANLPAIPSASLEQIIEVAKALLEAVGRWEYLAAPEDDRAPDNAEFEGLAVVLEIASQWLYAAVGAHAVVPTGFEANKYFGFFSSGNLGSYRDEFLYETAEGVLEVKRQIRELRSAAIARLLSDAPAATTLEIPQGSESHSRTALPDVELGNVSEREAPSWKPAIVFSGDAREPRVNGKSKKRMTPEQFKVVQALLSAGEDGLSKGELEKKSGIGDPLGVLRRLRKDPDYGNAIDMAGTRGRGYRVATYQPASTTIEVGEG